MKKHLTRLIAVMLSVITVIGFTACGGEVDIGGLYNYDYTISDEKITYTFYSSQAQFTDHENDQVIKFLEDKFNVKIKLQNGGTEFRKLLSTKLSADKNVPDLAYLIPTESSFVDWVDKGYFVPLNGYLDKIEEETGSSALKNMLNTAELKDVTSLGGKNYFFPQIVDVASHYICVRKDWMKQWAVSKGKAEDYYPTKISEFTDMLTYFHTNNLGGGSYTYGLCLCSEWDFDTDFMSAFGVTPYFDKQSDGSYKICSENANYDNYIGWIKNGLDTGYLYPDFSALTSTDARTKFEQGYAGAFIASGSNAYCNEYFAMGKYGHEDAVTFVPFPSADDSDNLGSPYGWSYYYGGYCISKNAKEPYRLVKIIDYLASDEGQTLLTYGVEGKHYTLSESGEYTMKTSAGERKYTLTTENLTNRKNEGVFVTPNVLQTTDIKDYYGKYDVGRALSPVPFYVKDGHLVINEAYDCFALAEDVKRYNEYIRKIEQDNLVNFAVPSKIISDVDVARYYSLCLDALKIYTLNVASGKNKDSELTTLNKKLSGNKIDKVYDYLKNN